MIGYVARVSWRVLNFMCVAVSQYSTIMQHKNHRSGIIYSYKSEMFVCNTVCNLKCVFLKKVRQVEQWFFRERVLIRIKYVCIKFYANTFSTSRVIWKNRSNYDKVSRVSQACWPMSNDARPRKVNWISGWLFTTCTARSPPVLHAKVSILALLFISSWNSTPEPTCKFCLCSLGLVWP